MDFVVGIDPSLTATAVCVLREDLTFFTSVFSSKKSEIPGVGGRLKRYHHLVGSVIVTLAEEVKRGNTIRDVFIEGYSYGSRGRAVMDTAEYGCLLRNHLMSEWIVPVEIAPSALKKFATGKGNADKLAVSLALQKRYDVSFHTSDEFDAYGLSRIAACRHGWCEVENEKQREVLKAII